MKTLPTEYLRTISCKPMSVVAQWYNNGLTIIFSRVQHVAPLYWQWPTETTTFAAWAVSRGPCWRHYTQHNDNQHKDTQHSDTQHKRLICDIQHKWHSPWKPLSITILCRDAECHYAECHVLFFVMLNFIMLIVVMLSVVAPRAQSIFHRCLRFKMFQSCVSIYVSDRSFLVCGHSRSWITLSSNQGTLTDGKGSVQMTSLYSLV